MSNDIFSLKLGNKTQKGIIIDVIKEDAIDKTGVALPKLVLIVDIPNKKRLRLDEAWVRDRKGELRAHGLWLKHDIDGNINQLSTIGKLMTHFKALTVKELLGKEVQIHPKKNDFMAIIAISDFNEEEI